MANATAVLRHVVDFPSEGEPLMINMTLGGLSIFDKSNDVRRVRYASEMCDRGARVSHELELDSCISGTLADNPYLPAVLCFCVKSGIAPMRGNNVICSTCSGVLM